jgi:putative transposase
MSEMMTQESKFPFHRRSIRLAGYDYSAEGSYFITLVTYQREHLFGEIVDGEMRLCPFGEIAREEWLKTKELRSNVEIIEDEFVVMPNHFHGIVHLFNDKLNKNGTENAVTFAIGTGTARRARTIEVFGHDEQVRAYSYTPLPERASFHSPSKTLGSLVRGFKIAVTTRINTLRAAPGQPVWLRNYYEHIITTEKEYDNIINYIYLNPENWGQKDEYYQA